MRKGVLAAVGAVALVLAGGSAVWAGVGERCPAEGCSTRSMPVRVERDLDMTTAIGVCVHQTYSATLSWVEVPVSALGWSSTRYRSVSLSEGQVRTTLATACTGGKPTTVQTLRMATVASPSERGVADAQNVVATLLDDSEAGSADDSWHGDDGTLVTSSTWTSSDNGGAVGPELTSLGLGPATRPDTSANTWGPGEPPCVHLQLVVDATAIPKAGTQSGTGATAAATVCAPPANAR